MKFAVNYRDLTDDQKARAQLATRTVKEIKTAVRKVSFAVERVVKQAMPVDTGRARASWGHWTPALLRKAEGGDAAGAAVWDVTEGGFSIEQGSNVAYIDALNDGHSGQAGAGFLDLAEKKGQAELEVEIDHIIDKYW